MFDLKLSILEEYAPFFVSGTILTIKLSIVAIIIGFFLGLFLALARLSSRRWLSVPAVCFIESIRGTPLLLQILVAYFGIIPLLMRKPDGEIASMLALSINAGAYIAETIRGGILSVDEGQLEAAKALGLSHFQSMRYVILPQALRDVVPALGNSFVSLIKDSSLASTIATPELMYWANAANAQYYRVWETFITTGIIYLILTLVTSRILARLERR
ncbi:amino acid ABC transporter permease [Dialister sp.]|uniref:amino acid ABC transporter permease n=1 Tax=Dialister sp. TaxID=1955814 RepID=UPI002E8127FA|nr:amino acid ABC transporter permease [Dialister sp.]MEE3452606.1 amino acid ABC transporter permease [Dialister sp.]